MRISEWEIGVRCLAAATLVLYAAGSLVAEPVGSIGGRIAISVVPDYSDSRKTPGLAGCEVHLVETEDQARDRLYPCGVWFQPPVGRYLFWAEQGSHVSGQTVVTYAGEKFTGRGLMLAKTMLPAGYVQLDPRTQLPDGTTFRVLSLASKRGRPFDRRLAGASAVRPVRMPAGGLIAGIFDRNGRALSLTGSETVAKGGRTVIAPAVPPKGKTAALVIIDRNEGVRNAAECRVALVTGSGREMPPAVHLRSEERIVAAWYDLAAPAAAHLRVQCGAATDPVDREVRLQPGAIETIRVGLRRRSVEPAGATSKGAAPPPRR